ncbi:multicopper oxidase domain-containing protein [Paenibacillus kobensis]|uniref:multicopper oxidase domain-containing protein n=1 Tax=Paenibacillus kobensis TaxID=59841 RepID=UPI0013E34555|nr:multicopper oxidase domain-containing protein [Paenibacillus kobensis]
MRTNTAKAWAILLSLLLLLAAGFSMNAVSSGLKAFAVTPVVKKFHLYATDGYMTLADGKKAYIWGYSLSNVKGTAAYPAPTLTVNEGDLVEVTLTNLGPGKEGIQPLAHTIHFHGLDTDQQNDGVPDTHPPVQPGSSFTYKFTAKHAGTYFYHCHVDTVEHLQMGMHGAFIVKAKNGIKQAWTGGPVYDKEYVMLLNEFDPVWHAAVEEGKTYDRTDFHPRYWTINGKSFPDTLNDPTTMVHATVGQRVLIRLINSGYEEHSIHLHGVHFQIIASDGRPLPAPIEKDTVSLGPAERYDILVVFDQSGEFPLHSHNIVDNTNDGVYPGGLHTMMCVDPKSGTSSGGHAEHMTGAAAAESHCGNESIEPGGTTSNSAANTANNTNAASVSVNIGALSVSVKELHVKVGDTVTWTNADRQVHTITSDDGLFNSGNIFPKGAWSYTFTKEGTYSYACTIHATIKGTVVVE